MGVHVGIGSWGDDAYVGVLYPPGLPKADRLSEYAKTFQHVEVNSTYYATPSAAAVKGWVRQTPAGFTFSIKLHRAISQSPAKAATGDLPRRILAAMQPLVDAERLACFLLLLPPRFTPDRHGLDELDGIAEALAPHAVAVELRDRGWVAGKQRAATLAHFRERKLAWVAVDMPRIAGSAVMPVVDEVTHPRLAYLRLHGRNADFLAAGSAAEGHHYAYTPREIGGLAKRVRKLASGGNDVFVIANNHAEDFAPKTALALRRLVIAD
jgi:uncharacterized protein YecE (DUF72 family)